MAHLDSDFRDNSPSNPLRIKHLEKHEKHYDDTGLFKVKKVKKNSYLDLIKYVDKPFEEPQKHIHSTFKVSEKKLNDPSLGDEKYLNFSGRFELFVSRYGFLSLPFVLYFFYDIFLK